MEENGDKKLTDGQLRNGRDMRECKYPESLHREGGREGKKGRPRMEGPGRVGAAPRVGGKLTRKRENETGEKHEIDG